MPGTFNARTAVLTGEVKGCFWCE